MGRLLQQWRPLGHRPYLLLGQRHYFLRLDDLHAGHDVVLLSGAVDLLVRSVVRLLFEGRVLVRAG